MHHLSAEKVLAVEERGNGVVCDLGESVWNFFFYLRECGSFSGKDACCRYKGKSGI